MNYLKIYPLTTSDGPGCRVSLYVSGCTFHCKGCHNPESWDFCVGEPFTDEIKSTILNLCSLPYIKGLSILGGEPLHFKNKETLLSLLKEFKSKYPNKDVWMWTGFKKEDLNFENQIFQYIDVLVTEPFILEERDISKLNLWRGSRNQRIIDVNKTKQAGRFIPLEGIPNNIL